MTSFRWWYYWGLWRPALWLCFAIAEPLTKRGLLVRIGRYNVLDTLLQIEDR